MNLSLFTHNQKESVMKNRSRLWRIFSTISFVFIGMALLTACGVANNAMVQKVVTLPDPLQLAIQAFFVFIVGWAFAQIGARIPWFTKLFGQYADEIAFALSGAVIGIIQTWLNLIPPGWEMVGNLALALIVAVLAALQVFRLLGKARVKGFVTNRDYAIGRLVSMPEPFVPGEYTALVDLNIRKQMDTESLTNGAGVYMRSVPFTVYQVYPEKRGIVWGRVSSNTGSGDSRYVGLRVNNNVKVQLENAFDPQGTAESLPGAINNLTSAVERLADK
jgi:hypothetical protein